MFLLQRDAPYGAWILNVFIVFLMCLIGSKSELSWHMEGHRGDTVNREEVYRTRLAWQGKDAGSCGGCTVDTPVIISEQKLSHCCWTSITLWRSRFLGWTNPACHQTSPYTSLKVQKPIWCSLCKKKRGQEIIENIKVHSIHKRRHWDIYL